MEQETRSETPTDSNRQENSKTSFLIEDILYRGQQNKTFKAPTDTRRSFEYERPEPKYFPVPNEIRPHVPAREGSYLQVMGALGAYLHTPNYKSVETPYFLSQGTKVSLLVRCFLAGVRRESCSIFQNLNELS